jgi:hypothetical protein
MLLLSLNCRESENRKPQRTQRITKEDFPLWTFVAFVVYGFPRRWANAIGKNSRRDLQSIAEREYREFKVSATD